MAVCDLHRELKWGFFIHTSAHFTHLTPHTHTAGVSGGEEDTPIPSRRRGGPATTWCRHHHMSPGKSETSKNIVPFKNFAYHTKNIATHVNFLLPVSKFYSATSKCLLAVSNFYSATSNVCWLSQFLLCHINFFVGCLKIFTLPRQILVTQKNLHGLSQFFCSTGHNAEWRRQAVLTTNDKESCSKSAESLETDIRNEYHHHCCVEFSTCPHHELHPWVTVQPPLTPRGGGGERGRGREGCRARIMNLRMTKKNFLTRTKFLSGVGFFL